MSDRLHGRSTYVDRVARPTQGARLVVRLHWRWAHMKKMLVPISVLTLCLGGVSLALADDAPLGTKRPKIRSEERRVGKECRL